MKQKQHILAGKTHMQLSRADGDEEKKKSMKSQYEMKT